MGSSNTNGTAQQYDKHPYQLSVEQLTFHFGGLDLEHGLNSVQVSELRAKHGENKLEGEEGVKWYAVLFKQVSNAIREKTAGCTLKMTHTWLEISMI